MNTVAMFLILAAIFTAPHVDERFAKICSLVALGGAVATMISALFLRAS